MKRWMKKVSKILPVLFACLALSVTAKALETPTLSLRYPTVSFEGAVENNIYFSISSMDDLYFKIFACMADGSYAYRKNCEYSILSYSHTLLANPATSASMGELVTELLNYGGAAQKYFDYRTDALANRGLATGGHIYDEAWIVQTPPTLDQAGMECCYCTLCQGEPLTREIPRLSLCALTLTSQPYKTGAGSVHHGRRCDHCRI